MEKISGIVVKFTEKYIVLIMPDGSFKNVIRSGVQTPLIGERFTLEAAKAPVFNYRWAVAVAAAAVCIVLAAFLTIGILLPDNTNPAYIVAVDINPSLEIQTDEQLRTLNITALNEDGKKIVNEISYKNKDITETLDIIVGKCISSGYLKQEKKGFIKITVISVQGKSFLYQNRIKASLQKLLADNRIDASLETGTASTDELDRAHIYGLSVNRYILYRDLIEKGIDITVEEAKKMPLSELRSYETLQKNGPETAGPGQDNGGESTDKTGAGGMPDNTGGTGTDNAVTSGGSKNSDASDTKRNTGTSPENGTEQKDATDVKAGAVSDTSTKATEATKAAEATEAESSSDIKKPDTTGPDNEVQQGNTIDPGQIPDSTGNDNNVESQPGTPPNPETGHGGTSSTGSSNKR